MATAAKFVQPIAIFLAYLIQLDVDVTGNITAKHVLHLGYHGNDHHFEIFSTPQKLPHTTVDIPTKFDERNPKLF